MPEPAPLAPSDTAAVADLLLAYRAATSLALYPTIWRLRLLLSSRVWEPEQDTAFWRGAAGRVHGLAFLWRRRPTSPYLVLERLVAPAHVSAELAGQMLAWGVRRARRLAAAGQTLTLVAAGLPPALGVADPVETLGFGPAPSDPQDRNVYLARSLETPLPAPIIPAGYTLRPLTGPAELEAYNALSGFAAVDAHHQRSLLASDEYALRVAADAAGRLAAYCECSFWRAEWRHTGRRIGWIDYLETRPELRGQGLGRALLAHCLAHLRAQGAETALLVTVSGNSPALRLYQAAGFQPAPVVEPPSFLLNVSAE